MKCCFLITCDLQDRAFVFNSLSHSGDLALSCQQEEQTATGRGHSVSLSLPSSRNWAVAPLPVTGTPLGPGASVADGASHVTHRRTLTATNPVVMEPLLAAPPERHA